MNDRYSTPKDKLIGALSGLLSRLVDGAVDAGLEEAQELVEEASRRVGRARRKVASRKVRRPRIVDAD